MKSEASWRSRVRPRRISSSADMSGQATTKSGGVPLRAMTCGCEGQPLSSLSRTHWGQDSPLGQAPMGRSLQDFLGTCSAIHRGSARPVPSSATLTDHERSKRKSMFTKARHRRQTDSSLLPADRVTPAGAAPTRTCGARAADMEALRLPVLSVLRRQRAPLGFCTGYGRWLVF